MAITAENVETLKNQARDTLDEFKSRAHESFEKASGKYHNTVGKMRDTTLADVRTTSVNYVRDNPIKSALIFVGVGISTGLFVAWWRR